MSKRKRRGQSSSKEAPRRRKSRPSPVIPIVVGLVVVAIIAGAIVSITNRSAANSAVAGDVPLATSQALATGSQPSPAVARASIQEATDRVERGEALLVDVRSQAAYDKSHAAGAVSFPEEEADARLGELPRDKELILYCT
ncbi:rhodanese-like domain-containing protein [Chloroflexota bacterium]